MTDSYYDDFKDKICVDCLVKKRGGYPTGIGVNLPCHKCQAPNIRWYHKATYGFILDDCGNHGTFTDDWDEESSSFEWP